MPPPDRYNTGYNLGPVVRRALRVLAVAAIVVALVACESYTSYGVEKVGTSAEEVVAQAIFVGHDRIHNDYGSSDGGRTWVLIEGGVDEPDKSRVIWGTTEVETPRGTYGIADSFIVTKPPGGEYEVSYSTSYLQTDDNKWTQAKHTHHLGSRHLSEGPSAIAYDEHSGNVIVAMGILGVVVGTPGGSWTPVPVGPYTPADFSLTGKAKTLLSSFDFWVLVLSFPISLTAVAFVIVKLLWGIPFTISSGFLFVLFTLPCAVLAIGISMYLLAKFGNDDAVLETNLAIGLIVFILWLFFIVAPAFLAVVSSWPDQSVPWKGVAISSAAMAAFIALPYLAWVMSIGNLGLTRLTVVLLFLATAIVLIRYMLISYRTGEVTRSPDKPIPGD